MRTRGTLPIVVRMGMLVRMIVLVTMMMIVVVMVVVILIGGRFLALDPRLTLTAAANGTHCHHPEG